MIADCPLKAPVSPMSTVTPGLPVRTERNPKHASAHALERALCNEPALSRWALAQGQDLVQAGLLVDWIDQTGSTNADLLNKPFNRDPVGPRVLVSRIQTGGRGRMGRPWTTIPGASLALSVAFERRVPSSNWQGLSIAVGAVLVEQLISSKEAPPSLKLKWPNDLWIDGRKVGGILIEVRRTSGAGQGGQGAQGAQGDESSPAVPIERVVIGVGLNRFDHPALAALGVPAGALKRGPVSESAGDPIDLAARVVAAILEARIRLETQGLADLLPLWRARDALVGLPVRVEDARAPAWSGIAAGIDDRGALRVRCAGNPPQIRIVIAGDVSVRPQDIGPAAEQAVALAPEETHVGLADGLADGRTDGLADVLTYGSLMFEPVWSAVVTGQYSSRSVRVDGWQRFVIPGEDYPGAVLSAGASMAAVLWKGVGADDLGRLDEFEGDQYQRVPVVVGPEGSPAWIYAWRGQRPLDSTLWDPDAFAQPEVMARFLAKHFPADPPKPS